MFGQKRYYFEKIRGKSLVNCSYHERGENRSDRARGFSIAHLAWKPCVSFRIYVHTSVQRKLNPNPCFSLFEREKSLASLYPRLTFEKSIRWMAAQAVRYVRDLTFRAWKLPRIWLKDPFPVRNNDLPFREGSKRVDQSEMQREISKTVRLNWEL